MEEGEPELAQAALEDIGVDLMETESLIDDILALARLDSVNVSRAIFARSKNITTPAMLVDAALRRFRARYPDCVVEVEQADARLPELHVHIMLVRRALENLLENAHKHARTSEPITIRLSMDNGWAIFEVIDRGEGIGEEELQRVFEPFFRAAGAQTEGLGLGLGLVQRIVQAHGGTVSVESVAGAGASVRVALPGSGLA